MTVDPADAADAARKGFSPRGIAQRRVLNGLSWRSGSFKTRLPAIDSGALSIPDQIKTMKDARIVAGGHGAALTNLIFAAEPALVVELFV